MGDGASLVDCPFCGARCDSSVIDEHVNLHLVDETSHSKQERIVIGCDSDSDQDAGQEVACQCCGALVDLHELDSHEEAHRLQEMDAEHSSVQGVEEARQFELLQMKYGFSDKRPGSCHRCGKPGHWARECPSNSAAAATGPQQRLTTVPSELVLVQQPDSNVDVGVNVIALLQACLEAQPKANSLVYLCGPVGFHGRQAQDIGFGCGYRNVQMQASHQLMVGSAASQTLFGGSGNIVNIPALQAWLEVAWQAGFDPSGAAMFGQQVQCTRKWIGASDAAALLRYFGCKALLTDFTARPSTNETGFTVHDAECDLCHQCPITGIRHKSLKSPNVDVCNKCRQAPGAQQHAPFVPLGQQPQSQQLKLQQRPQAAAAAAPPAAAGGSSGPAANGGSNASGSSSSKSRQPNAAAIQPPASCAQQHRALAEWVWAYFQGQGGAASSAAAMPAAAAGSVPPQGVASPSAAGGTAAAAAAQSSRPPPAAAGGGSGGGPGSSGSNAFAKLMRRHSPVVLTDRPPLFLQHEGHSRTVVGIERCCSPRRQGQDGTGAEYSLVLLDPGISNVKLLTALRSQQGWQRLVKRGMHTLAKKQEYQILYVAPEFVPEGPQREALKILRVADRYTS